MAIQIAERPLSLSGCAQTWSETYASNVLRTDMEMSGYVKVRRRSTGKMTMIDVTMTLASELYQDFFDWYYVASQSGVLPTRIRRPQDGKEMVARFSGPPTIQFIDKNAFVATMKFEQTPVWSDL